MKYYFVYIATNPGRTVLYTGVTGNLEKRLSEHLQNRGNQENFAGKYYCYNLVYYEKYTNINDAINRETEIKLMKRETKFKLIQEVNPQMQFILPETNFI